MKKYNFETVCRRYGIGSGKWADMRNVNPDIGEDVIPFSVADMELENPPEVIEGLKKFLDHTVMGYAMPTQKYLESVCSWMKRRHGWEIKPDWIKDTHGVIDAFFTAIKAYTKEGDGVMLMTPVYYPMYMGIERNRRVLVENKLINRNGRYEIDFEDFEAKAKLPDTKLFILCSPHNPASRVWTKEELTRIGRICIDNGILIVSDEIHFDLIMPGYHHTVFASISDEFAQNCVICTAPSKTFNLAGLQTSNIIIPDADLRERFWTEVCTTSGNPKCNILGYEACRLAYTGSEDWLDQCIGLIDRNRKTVTDFMAAEFPAIRITPMEGTYLLWMDFRSLGIDSQRLSQILRMEAQLFFDDGIVFGEAGNGFERWNLACPARYIEAALIRLKNTLCKYI